MLPCHKKAFKNEHGHSTNVSKCHSETKRIYEYIRMASQDELLQQSAVQQQNERD